MMRFGVLDGGLESSQARKAMSVVIGIRAINCF